MTESRHEIVIIGAGPAGSVAALVLARAGRDVLLVDRARFPRFKVCGCCLSARTLHLLASLGLGSQVDASGAKELGSFRVAARGRRLDLGLPSGRALTRAALDSLLVRAAREAGARFLDSTRATVPERAVPATTVPGTLVNTWPGNSRAATAKVATRVPGTTLAATARRVVLEGADRSEVEADLVLVADGLAGTALPSPDAEPVVEPSSRLGAGTVMEGDGADTVEPGVIHMAVGRGGYVGMVRVEDGTGQRPRIAVAAALDPAAVRASGGLADLACDLVKRAGFAVPTGLDRATWRGTPALTRHRRASLPGVLLLGDAAGYVEPFTGQGIEWAVRSGLALAELIGEAGAELLEATWRRRHLALVRRRQLACRTLVPLLRRDALTSVLLRIASLRPGLLRGLVRHVAAI